MSPCCPDRRRGLAALLLGLAAASAVPAAPRAVEAFDADTWPALRAEVQARQRPLLVVFTATWCAVCPEVVAQLARDARRQRSGVPLVVAVADLAPGEADARLLAAPYYGGADRLMAFDGPAAALRHGVDPRWRGVTPYVAWLAPGQPPQFVPGAPDAAQTARWFAPPATTRPGMPPATGPAAGPVTPPTPATATPAARQ